MQSLNELCANDNRHEPLVSVIMPTYNCARYISQAIESVLNQDYSNIELIIVDDGSKDRTDRVVSNYSNKGKIIYKYQENRGVAASRNNAIALSKGKYISFLDADDIWLQNNLKDKVNLLETNNDICLVFSNFEIQSHSEIAPYQKTALHIKVPDKVFCSSIKNSSGERLFYGTSAYKYMLRSSIFPWTGTIIIRRDCLNEVGRFDEKMRVTEDLDLWLRIIVSYPTAYIDNVTAIYKHQRSNLTKDRYRYFFDKVSFYSKLRENAIFNPDKETDTYIKNILHEHIIALGYILFKQNRMQDLRTYLIHSIALRPLCFLQYYWLFLSFLPHRFRKYLETFKHYIASVAAEVIKRL